MSDVNREDPDWSLHAYEKRLEALNRIDLAILKSAMPEEVSGIAVQLVADLVPCKRVSITLFDAEFRWATVLAVQSDGAAPKLNAGRRFPFSAFGDFVSLKNGIPQQIQDVGSLPEDNPLRDPLLAAGIQSAVNIPLIVEDALTGTLNLGTDKPGGITPGDIRLATELAVEVAVAIRHSRLVQENEQQRERLTTLLEISRMLAKTIELDTILQVTIDMAVRAMCLETGAIYLLQGDDLYLGATTPPLPPEMPEAFRIAQLAHHPHIGQAITSGSPVYLRDAETADLTPQEKEVSVARGLRSLLYVPLRVGRRRVGVLIMGSVGRTQTFTPSEIDLCRTFSAQMALAVENAQLHHRTQLHAAELETRVAKRTADLQAANAQLKLLGQVKDDFVANVSHELRTPLTSIKLYLNLVKANPDKQDTYLHVLERETERLEDLVEGLLTLSRIDQNREPFSPEPVDLNRLVAEFVADRMALAESKQIALTVNPGSLGHPIQADPSLISQVLSILLTNAIAYTPAGGKVDVSTLAGEDPFVGFRVDDTGPGIPAGEIPLLFDRFYRGQASFDSGITGTGLGLAIASEIVDRHRGRIDVTSEGIPGEGAAFTVWLPVELPPEDEPVEL